MNSVSGVLWWHICTCLCTANPKGGWASWCRSWERKTGWSRGTWERKTFQSKRISERKTVRSSIFTFQNVLLFTETWESKKKKTKNKKQNAYQSIFWFTNKSSYWEWSSKKVRWVWKYNDEKFYIDDDVEVRKCSFYFPFLCLLCVCVCVLCEFSMLLVNVLTVIIHGFFNLPSPSPRGWSADKVSSCRCQIPSHSIRARRRFKAVCSYGCYCEFLSVHLSLSGWI